MALDIICIFFAVLYDFFYLERFLAYLAQCMNGSSRNVLPGPNMLYIWFRKLKKSNKITNDDFHLLLYYLFNFCGWTIGNVLNGYFNKLNFY
jgi:hypothetical protein